MPTAIVLKHLLIENDFPLSWVSVNCKHVSRRYFYEKYPLGDGPRDARGQAAYTTEDASSLLQAAYALRNGQTFTLKQWTARVCDNPKCENYRLTHAGVCA